MSKTRECIRELKELRSEYESVAAPLRNGLFAAEVITKKEDPSFYTRVLLTMDGEPCFFLLLPAEVPDLFDLINRLMQSGLLHEAKDE